MSIKVHIMLKKICTSETETQTHKFYCEKCDYSCNKKFLFDQHLRTKKHRNSECSKMLKKICAPVFSCACGRTYKHEQSLKRHQAKCAEHSASSRPNASTECAQLRSMVASLLEHNQKVISENSEMRDLVRDMLPKMGTGTTTINNRFNINVFLHEECKNAVNLTDFVKELPIDGDALSLTQKDGYAAGIANIFLRGLRSLDMHLRPIHCSDTKREILYVKDNNTWEKGENGQAKMRDAISTITRKQISKIKHWEEEHPGWRQTDGGSQDYVHLVQSVTGPPKSSAIQEHNKIIRTIAKEVKIGRDGPKDD